MFPFIKYINEQRIKKSLANSFYALAKIQSTLFNAYLKPDYLSRQTSYAKMLHEKRTNYFRTIDKVRSRIKDHSKYMHLFLGVECLYEIICSLHLLRYRVNEYSLFEICQREMQGLEKESVNLLVKLARSFFHKNVTLNTNELAEKIEAFERLYGRTLQVVAADPVVFLFFAQDMHSLRDKLDSIITLLGPSVITTPVIDPLLLLREPGEAE